MVQEVEDHQVEAQEEQALLATSQELHLLSQAAAEAAAALEQVLTVIHATLAALVAQVGVALVGMAESLMMDPTVIPAQMAERVL